MQKQSKVCIQKTFGDVSKRHHELIIDSHGQQHSQVRLQLKMTEQGIKCESTKVFRIDYGEVVIKEAHEIVGQIVYDKKIFQITKNHVLLMREEEDRMVVTRVICDRNYQRMQYLDNDWIYAQNNFFNSYDNEQDGPLGPV